MLMFDMTDRQSFRYRDLGERPAVIPQGYDTLVSCNDMQTNLVSHTPVGRETAEWGSHGLPDPGQFEEPGAGEHHDAAHHVIGEPRMRRQ